QYIVVPVTADFNVTPYHPIENIAIDCGSPSTNASSLDSRSWVGDGNGKFSPIEPQNNKYKSSAIKAVSPPPSPVDNIPYSTARLSYSQFTYSIPLTSGPKFIRLHFYPTSYPDFDDPSKKAFFSVEDEGQRLNLTFTPSPDITDSYAFINAIEVVSMPINLYYTPKIDDGSVPFVGQAQGRFYTLEKNTALEMMYRVRVGGREIPPGEDTGMFRGWLKDDAYLTIAKPSAFPVNESINLTFSSDTPSYSAPREIEITKEGDRVFEILLANLTAETAADVI
ncbi:hypothetical protein Gohar_015760, partial [Gossypium harknessii]|nr:hypothetical protein [Gossypium harknessii]